MFSKYAFLKKTRVYEDQSQSLVGKLSASSNQTVLCHNYLNQHVVNKHVGSISCVKIMLLDVSNDSVQVEKELRDICQDILDVLDKHLIPSR